MSRWREFLARFDGVPAPRWETADDLSRMGLDAVARDATTRALAAPRVPSPAERHRAAQLRRVAAEQTWPRLRVGYDQLAMDWLWFVTAPDASCLERGTARTHPEALAIGMAHLAVHSAAWAIDQLGAELPAGWERITP